MIDIDKIKAGDEAEADKLIEDFTPQVVILAYRLSAGRRDFREDLIQVGLLALVDAAKTYNGLRGASFTTFALVCAKYRMIDERRKIIRQERYGAGGVTEAEPDGQNDGYETMPDPTDNIAIREIMRNLPDILSAAEFKVFFLKMQGASYAEIARSLNVGEKAVDNALKRARKKIYELYHAI